MNFARFFQASITGALFSGIMLAICVGLITINSNSTGELGLKESDFWWLTTILGGISGLIIDSIICGMVVALNLNVIRGGVYVFIFLVIPVTFLLFSGDKFDKDIKYSGIAFLVVETLTGMVVPLITILLYKGKQLRIMGKYKSVDYPTARDDGGFSDGFITNFTFLPETKPAM